MNKNINIKKTFNVIRNLPLAVSFQQVEQWVLNATPKSKEEKSRLWFHNLLNRFSKN